MSFIEAILLGIIQGITEFLPISSSGHLVLAQSLLGLKNLKDYIVFDMICHLGTLLAIFLVYCKTIKDIFLNDRKKIFLILVAILPLFPLLLLMKPIKATFDQPEYLGYFFLITAFILYLGIYLGKDKPDAVLQKKSYKDAFLIGLFQAVAILPGVSRSGSTISSARMLGWNAEKAVTFSFLLAIPTILGGVVVELTQIFLKDHPNTALVSPIQYITGFLFSFIFGWGSLLLLQKLASKHKFIYFVWYCLFLGFITIFYFNFFI